MSCAPEFSYIDIEFIILDALELGPKWRGVVWNTASRMYGPDTYTRMYSPLEVDEIAERIPKEFPGVALLKG